MESSLKKEARRRSELDVERVAKEIEEQKGTAGEDGRRKKRRTNGINVPYAQAAELLDDSCYSGQVHENDLAEVVVVCEPGLPKMMGALHPAAALYERFVNIQQSILEHAKFREVLRKKGIKVLTVREILHYGLDNLRCRIDLEGLAMEMLRYKDGSSAKGDEGLDGNGDNKDLPAEENAIGFNVQDLVGDDYKRKVLENMSPDQLIDVILTNPTVTVKPSFRDTGVSASYEFEPLTNLIFTRDQQITTAKGIVMASLRSQQRQHEIKIMKFCFQKLGIQVIAEVERPGYLEGGDFFPAGSDLCFCGVGLRSNENAVQQLMEKDAFGTKRVAIVKDLFDKNQDRMHLDCVFSILSESCVLMLEEMMGKESPTRRLVDEYAVDLKGNYTYSRKDVEFSQYLKENGFKIIPVTAAEQLKYACNVVNLGSSCILSCHAPTARKICQSPHFSGTMEYVDYSAITAMYGALHCSTQIVKRKVQ